MKSGKSKNVKIIQLSENDLKKNPNLDKKDIGKWGFIMNGHYHGFCDSKEKLEKWISEINTKVY